MNGSLLGPARNPAPLCLAEELGFHQRCSFVLVPDKDSGRGALKTVFQRQVGEDESPRCVIARLDSLFNPATSLDA